MTDTHHSKGTFDRPIAIVALAIGLVSTLLVLLQAAFWEWNFGSHSEWGRWATAALQLGFYVATVVVSIIRLRRGRQTALIALTGLGLAAITFWALEYMVLVALPCPSFC